MQSGISIVVQFFPTTILTIRQEWSILYEPFSFCFCLFLLSSNETQLLIAHIGSFLLSADMKKLMIKLYRKRDRNEQTPNPMTYESDPSQPDWSTTKSIFGFFDRNVFDRILLEFVRLLPYNSTEELLLRRVDRKKYLHLFLIGFLLVLNILRLFLMVANSTPRMYWIIVGYFKGLNGNRREWLLVISNIFLAALTLSKFSILF